MSEMCCISGSANVILRYGSVNVVQSSIDWVEERRLVETKKQNE